MIQRPFKVNDRVVCSKRGPGIIVYDDCLDALLLVNFDNGSKGWFKRDGVALNRQTLRHADDPPAQPTDPRVAEIARLTAAEAEARELANELRSLLSDAEARTRATCSYHGESYGNGTDAEHSARQRLAKFDAAHPQPAQKEPTP